MTSLRDAVENVNDVVARSDAGVSIAIALLCMALSAIAVIPFFFFAQPPPAGSASESRMPQTHDMRLHYDQMRSFYEGLKGGSIYPRWEMDTNRGFGAPTTSFYPPAIYYVTSAMFALSGDWTTALMLSLLVVMAGSGAALYLYARETMSRAAACCAMGAYVVLPYHLVDQYQRGAIAELLGFVWMPLMLMCGERLMDRSKREVSGGAIGADAARGSGEAKRRSRVEARRKRWAIVGLAASYGMFVWSHPPTAYQFGLGYGAYVMAAGLMRREWRGVVGVVTGCVLGLGISAAYLLPAALEQNLVRSDYIAQQYPYQDSYVLFMLRPGPDNYFAFFYLVDKMWILGLLVIMVAGITLLAIKPRSIMSVQGLKQRILLWLILGCFASFMMTGESRHVGALLPGIEMGVFAWRMLSIVTLAEALLAGACAHVAFISLRQGRKYEFAFLGSLALLILLGNAAFSWEEVVKPCYNSPAFVPNSEHMNLAMQPRTAQGDIFKLPLVEPAMLARGNGRISVEKWEPEHRGMVVELSKPDRLLIRTFYFPGWTAEVDGEIVNITNGRAMRVQADGSEGYFIRDSGYAAGPRDIEGTPESPQGDLQLGDIAIELAPGIHHVSLDFRDTPIRRLAGMLTCVSVCMLLALMFTPLALRSRQ